MSKNSLLNCIPSEGFYIDKYTGINFYTVFSNRIKKVKTDQKEFMIKNGLNIAKCFQTRKKVVITFISKFKNLKKYIYLRYDPETDNWAGGSYPSLQKARLAHGACVVHDALGGTIYAAGGSPQVIRGWSSISIH